MSANSFRAQVTDPAFVTTRIEALEQRLQSQGRGQRLTEGDATLGDLTHDIGGLARRIARTLAEGEYRFSPVRQRRLVTGGKERVVHQAGLLDTLVQGVLGRALADELEPLFHDSLHSYRRGRSSMTAVRAWVRFLSEHRTARPDPRQRGLYVLRRDVRGYGESIPNEADGPLLAKLRVALGGGGADGDDLQWSLRLLGAALRPDVWQQDGSTAPLPTGTPTGSALQPTINNLYLADLDRELAEMARGDGLNLRFGDDLLFAHSDPQIAREASLAIDSHVARLGLALNIDERADHYLTGCGRSCEQWPATRVGSRIAFVGFDIGFDGRVGLTRPKRRELLRQLRARWKHAEAVVAGAQPATRGTDHKQRAVVLSAITNAALDPGHPLCVPVAPALRLLVNDRTELGQLDHGIALAIACAVTGRRGPRAFRDVSYRSLRTDAGLDSLLMARNRSHRDPFSIHRARP